MNVGAKVGKTSTVSSLESHCTRAVQPVTPSGLPKQHAVS